MASTRPTAAAGRSLLTRRNLLVLGAGVLTLAAGYAVLQAGHPTAAAVLLVVGYCVLLPLGIAL